MDAEELTREGCDYLSVRGNSAAEFLNKAFNIRLGRGLYGECLVNFLLSCIIVGKSWFLLLYYMYEFVHFSFGFSV